MTIQHHKLHCNCTLGASIWFPTNFCFVNLSPCDRCVNSICMETQMESVKVTVWWGDMWLFSVLTSSRASLKQLTEQKCYLESACLDVDCILGFRGTEKIKKLFHIYRRLLPEDSPSIPRFVLSVPHHLRFYWTEAAAVISLLSLPTESHSILVINHCRLHTIPSKKWIYMLKESNKRAKKS